MPRKNHEEDDCARWKSRPKRKIVKPCLDYSQVLLREEEQALKKALYVSLRDTKTDQECTSNGLQQKKQKTSHNEKLQESSCVEKESTNKSCEPKPKLNKAKEQNQKKKFTECKLPNEDRGNPEEIIVSNKRQLNEKPTSVARVLPNLVLGGKLNSDLHTSHAEKQFSKMVSKEQYEAMSNKSSGNCNNLQSTSLRTKGTKTRRQLRAQRKFAHSQPCSPNSLLLQRMGTSSGARPKTEDFIKFLCLRGTAGLPKELEFFNSPVLPPSPLSSDEDDYLPLSPFFKRQVDSSSSKAELYDAYRHQLDCESASACSGSERKKKSSSRNLSSFFDETDNSPSTRSSSPGFSTAVSDCTSTEVSVNTSCGLEEDRQLPPENQANVEAAKDEGLRKRLGSQKSLEDSETSKEISDNEWPQAIDEKGSKFQEKPLPGRSHVEHSELSQEISSVSLTSNSVDSCDVKLKSTTTSNACRKSRSKGKKPDANAFENELEHAPTFRPMEQEFRDPMKYIRKITPFVLKYGMCILVPPAGWQPSSSVSDDIRFGTKIQQVHRLKKRNPETTKFVLYLHKCLGETSDLMEALPQIGSCEVDLLQMSKVFESAGGVAKVNTPRKWHKVADSLHIPKNAQGRVNKLQDIYYKYVLPFDILSSEEKERIKREVELELLTETQALILSEPEFKGKSASVSSFHRIASNAQEMYGRGQTNTHALENDFWHVVAEGKRHVASLSGDIDTMNCESSFHVARSKSRWNLSSLPQSQASLLRHLGVVPGLTTSSLKFSSVFSTSSWQKAPDELLKIEYLHAGANKIWYAVPAYMETALLHQAKKLMQTGDRETESIRNFLISDTMGNNSKTFKQELLKDQERGYMTILKQISPLELLAEDCRISRAIQNEGQFLLCLPNVYHCVVSSGYSLTESCYFVQDDWFQTRLTVDKKFLNPAVKFPAEMVILNFAESQAQQSKKDDINLLLIELAKNIRQANMEFHQKLTASGALMSREIPQGKLKRVAVDWETCDDCERPLYPFVVWRGNHFYCFDHAIEAMGKGNSESEENFEMFTHWNEEQLESLILRLEDLTKDEQSDKEQCIIAS